MDTGNHDLFGGGNILFYLKSNSCLLLCCCRCALKMLSTSTYQGVFAKVFFSSLNGNSGLL